MNTRDLTWLEQAAQTLVPEYQTEQSVNNISNSSISPEVTVTITTGRAPDYDEALQGFTLDGSVSNVDQLLTERRDLLCQV